MKKLISLILCCLICGITSAQLIKQKVEKQKKQQGVPSTYNEDIRKIVFNMVLEITNNDDLAAYISDDFGLIWDAEKVDINNNWINVLWQSYKKGEIPSR